MYELVTSNASMLYNDEKNQNLNHISVIKV